MMDGLKQPEWPALQQKSIAEIAVHHRLQEHQLVLQQFVQDWISQHDMMLQSVPCKFREPTRTVSDTGLKFQGSEQESDPSNSVSVGAGSAVASVEYRSSEIGAYPALAMPCELNNKPKLKRTGSSVGSVSDLLGPMRGPNPNVPQIKQPTPAMTRFTDRRSSFSYVQGLIPVSDEPPKPTLLMKLVSSKWFEGLCGACILINATVIAFAADYAAHNLSNPRTSLFDGLERGFTIFYFLELILRLMAHKVAFYLSQDRLWNMFDTALVISAVYDQIVEFTTTGQESNANIVFLRIVRVMKMLKLLRMVRIMRMFKELRLIVTAICGSLKSMFWAVLLILIITYMVGICFLQASTSYLQSLGHNSTPQSVALRHYWGSVSTAMLSLYQASTNGEGWAQMASALVPAGGAFYVLFVLYIAFFMFVVMNTLTSLFIEATIQNAEKDKNMMIREELQRKSEYVNRAIELFQNIDQDASGDISEDEFRKHAGDPEMVAFAASLELDVTDIAQFYNMLSCRGKYTVDVDTFVNGCIKLKGTARSMDLQGLIALQKRSSRNLEQISEACDHIAAVIQEAIAHQNRLTMQERNVATPHSAVSCSSVKALDSFSI